MLGLSTFCRTTLRFSVPITPRFMGESTWMWPDALRIKKRLPVRDEGPTQAMATGIALEPEAQRHYCDKAGIIVEPVCVQSLEHGWLRASLDGMTADGQRVVEIKCGGKTYRNTAISRRPPKHYFGHPRITRPWLGGSA